MDLQDLSDEQIRQLQNDTGPLVDQLITAYFHQDQEAFDLSLQVMSVLFSPEVMPALAITHLLRYLEKFSTMIAALRGQELDEFWASWLQFEAMSQS